MYVVVCGDVNHDKITEGISKSFATIPTDCPNPTLIVPENNEKPIFSASMINIRDDDVENGHVGLFYQVPGYNSKVFPHLLLMQRMFGN
jgi:predicted Zn-dependent peptidase